MTISPTTSTFMHTRKSPSASIIEAQCHRPLRTRNNGHLIYRPFQPPPPSNFAHHHQSNASGPKRSGVGKVGTERRRTPAIPSSNLGPPCDASTSLSVPILSSDKVSRKLIYITPGVAVKLKNHLGAHPRPYHLFQLQDGQKPRDGAVVGDIVPVPHALASSGILCSGRSIVHRVPEILCELCDPDSVATNTRWKGLG
ncbi:hypothetical protein KC347_g240 [Hortaea werneckii]|nr:hypothetical protein KC347_g240 [Hortaea werneckii]